MAFPLRQIEQYGIGHTEAAQASAAGSVALVDRIYSSITPFYDVVFGPVLQPGRRIAIERMALEPGTRILEVGVGRRSMHRSILNSVKSWGSMSPRGCSTKPANESIANRLRHVRVARMTPRTSPSPTNPSTSSMRRITISAVPDPVKVAREMRRVCNAERRSFS